MSSSCNLLRNCWAIDCSAAANAARNRTTPLVTNSTPSLRLRTWFNSRVAHRHSVAHGASRGAAASLGALQYRSDGAIRQDAGCGASALPSPRAGPVAQTFSGKRKRVDRRLRQADGGGVGKPADQPCRRMAAGQPPSDRRADRYSQTALAQGLQPGIAAPGTGPVDGPAARVRHCARNNLARRRPGRLQTPSIAS